MNLINLAGKRFGILTAIQRVPSGIGKRTIWLCRCDCGSMKTAATGSLVVGDVKSCGCQRHEAARQRFIKMNTSHGWSGTPTHETWKSILQRCLNKNNPSFKWYGGRGIKVCKRWRLFKNFLKDMGKRPDGKSIERKNHSLGYCKSNCRWATATEQANNKRSNIMITHAGATMTIAQWCRKLGLPYDAIHGRIQDRGWSPERAFSQPIQK